MKISNVISVEWTSDVFTSVVRRSVTCKLILFQGNHLVTENSVSATCLFSGGFLTKAIYKEHQHSFSCNSFISSPYLFLVNLKID